MPGELLACTSASTSSSLFLRSELTGEGTRHTAKLILSNLSPRGLLPFGFSNCPGFWGTKETIVRHLFVSITPNVSSQSNGEPMYHRLLYRS